MKVAFDAQNLFEEKKTGIGWTIEKIIKNIDIPSEDEFTLNYFAFRKKKEKEQRISSYRDLGYKTRVCSWFPLGLYRRLWNVLPLPYSLFMGRDTDITQFFNYVIPPGVRGKKIVYIYDMVYKACPETMEEVTRIHMEKNVEKSCRRADAIITISEFSKQEIIKYLGVPADKIFVVPCGVERERYHADIDSRKIEDVKRKFGITGEYFLYLGTLEPRKNIAAVIEAYYELKQRSINTIPKLVLAGKKGWGYETLFQLTQSRHLEEDVIFTDYVSEDDKPLLLSGAICFLFPSLYEGFGMPPLEAMACGTPVIVSKAASLPEVVGDAGIQVETDSSVRLTDAMEQLLSDEALRRELGIRGIERARLFDWGQIAGKLVSIYKQMM